ncbi:hypothetical protein ACQP2X_08785 [Actinoplanes sp. CA-131856]
MTTTTNPTDTTRHALTDGLHALADFLAEHPDVPAHADMKVLYCVLGDDDAAGLTNLSAIAAALGAEVTGTGGAPITEHTTHFQAGRRFGPVAYRAVYVTKAEMADYAALSSYSSNIRAERPEVTA